MKALVSSRDVVSSTCSPPSVLLSMIRVVRGTTSKIHASQEGTVSQTRDELPSFVPFLLGVAGPKKSLGDAGDADIRHRRFGGRDDMNGPDATWSYIGAWQR